MKLKLKDIITKGEKGQVWEGIYFTIRISDIGMIITPKFESDIESTLLRFDAEYTLARKQYDFNEAFKAYEKGKEIESIESSTRFKKMNGLDCFYGAISKEWLRVEAFSIKEIEGKWYLEED